jgi:hypothetical protein
MADRDVSHPLARVADMQLIQEFLYDYPLLALLQAALTVWMLIDSYRREEAEPYWFWVILFVPVVGTWVYFFVVLVPSLKPGRMLAWFQGRPSLAEMRYRAETLPTLVNHLALAQRLMEEGGHGEALPHLLAAQKLEPDHCLVLYTLARCHVEQGHPELGVPVLEGLVAREPRWANYSGWRLLAKARSAAGDAAGAALACRELARLTGAMQDTCLLAEYLLAAGQTVEARVVLDRALRDHDFAPRSVQWRNARWAREARRLLRQAETADKPG